MYIYIHIYIYIKRERESARERGGEGENRDILGERRKMGRGRERDERKGGELYCN